MMVPRRANLGRRRRRRRRVVAAAICLTSASAQVTTEYSGRACGGQAAGLGARCARRNASTVAECWDYCRSELEVEAAYTREGVCCCAESCPCLVEDLAETQLAVSARLEPGRCRSEDFWAFPNWDCASTPVATFPVDVLLASEDERNEDCYRRCDTVAAVSNSSECRCYDECACHVRDVDAVCALDTRERPPFHCPEENGLDDDFVTYSYSYDPATDEGGNFTIGSSEPTRLSPPTHYSQVDCESDAKHAVALDMTVSDTRLWCWDTCLDLGGASSIVAALANEGDELCWCYRTCDCLKVDVGSTKELSVADGVEPESCAALSASVIDDDLYDSLYYSYDSHLCVGANLTCFYGFDYSSIGDSKLHRYQCYAACTNWFVPTRGPLDAAYGDPATGECCCVSTCDCMQEQSDSYLLAISLDGPTFANASRFNLQDDDDAAVATFQLRETNDVVMPPTCPSSSSKKSKNQIAPGVDRADLWWIVLLCVLCLVAVLFFLKVEEVDRFRRRNAAPPPPPKIQSSEDARGDDDAYDDDEAKVDKHNASEQEMYDL